VKHGALGGVIHNESTTKDDCQHWSLMESAGYRHPIQYV